MLGPGGDGVEDGCGSVDDGELVVSSRETTPLLEVAEPPLDDVAVAVVDLVEGWWPTAAGTASSAVSCLIVGLGDHRNDRALAQVSADRPRGVGLVAAQSLRASTRPADRASHPQLGQQRQQSRRIVSLAGRDGDDQGQAVPVDKVVDLGRQPAPRVPYTVIRRLDPRIVVIRPSPLCGG